MATSAEDMAARQGGMLAELAELTLDAARILHGRLGEAQTPAEARDLGLAFQRVSRSLRQTLMLEARLAKDRRAAEREDEAAGARAREDQVQTRKFKVRQAVSREVLDACEDEEEAEPLLEELEACLDDYVRGHDFEASSLEELVAILCRDLGLDDDEDPDDGDEGDPDGPPDAPPPAGPPALAYLPGAAPAPNSS
jgi:hypothetical protein